MSFTETAPAIVVSRRRILAIAAGAAVVVVPNGLRSRAAPGAQSSDQIASPEFPAADVIHEISVSYEERVYDAMVQTFMDTADKEWIEATLTIDGVTYERVGMRLKGNSSLMVIRGGPEGGPMTRRSPGGEGDGTPPAGADQIVDGRIVDDAGGASPELMEHPLSVEEPEGLPWLIRLDKFVEGQNHNGVVNLVIRSNRTKTALNEAVALELLDAAGLASQRAAPAKFTVNDGPSRYRLAVELPDDPWMAMHFAADGLLYKAEAGGDYSYRGDDPEAYTDVFELEAGGTGDDAADMVPLVAFLDFLHNSDDEIFASELPERLDVEAFATYLAMMDLIGNHDDIDGPGNNSYLYSDPVSGRITVVPWDMNLAFGPEGVGLVEFRGDGPPPDGGNIVIFGPGGATPVATDGQDDGPHRQAMGPPGGMMPPPGANPLVQRYTGIAEYADLVETRTSSLRAQLYDTGLAAEILSRWIDVLRDGANGLVDAETIASESEAVAEFFTQQ